MILSSPYFVPDTLPPLSYLRLIKLISTFPSYLSPFQKVSVSSFELATLLFTLLLPSPLPHYTYSSNYPVISHLIPPSGEGLQFSALCYSLSTLYPWVITSNPMVFNITSMQMTPSQIYLSRITPPQSRSASDYLFHIFVSIAHCHLMPDMTKAKCLVFQLKPSSSCTLFHSLFALSSRPTVFASSLTTHSPSLPIFIVG